MSFVWKRRKTEKELEAERLPALSDDANWHEWESAGKKLISEDRVGDAISFLAQAVDRFDSNPAELGRMLCRIRDTVVDLGVSLSVKGRAVPTHLLAKIDDEIAVKFPSVSDDVPKLTDLVADAFDARIPSADGPGELVMIVTDALYSEIGFMWCSRDPREDIVRSARAAEICARGVETAETMRKATGQILPKEAVRYLSVYRDFAVSVKYALVEAMDGMSDAELDSITDYRVSHPADILPYLLEGLNAANSTVSRSSSARRKGEEDWKTNVKLFADIKVSTD